MNFRTFLLAGLLFVVGCSSRQPARSLAPRIIGSIEFMGGNMSGSVQQKTLGAWWTEKLKLGTDAEAYEFLTATNGQNKRIRTETCQQYTNATGQGAYAPTTADMASEVWFVQAVAILTFMEKAQPYRHPLDDDFLSRLPVSLVGWSGSDEENRINTDTSNGLTLQHYARLRKLTKWKQAGHVLKFETQTKNFAVEELACGDSDGDGTEDALIFVMWRYRGGSGFGYELQLVRKSAAGSKLELSRLDHLFHP